MSDIDLDDLFYEEIEEKVKEDNHPAVKLSSEQRMLQHYQISVLVVDPATYIIGEYGRNLSEATPEELVAWAKRACPTVEEPDLLTAAQSAVEKNIQPQFFDLVLTKHKQSCYGIFGRKN